jgi:hypothetical protein
VQFLNSSTVGMSDAPGGAKRLLLLKVGGLLTAGGGGVSSLGAGDVAVACRLTLTGGLLSLGRSSLGGVARRASSSERSRWPRGKELLSIVSSHLQPL